MVRVCVESWLEEKELRAPSFLLPVLVSGNHVAPQICFPYVLKIIKTRERDIQVHIMTSLDLSLPLFHLCMAHA